jgi:hypothetical protein
MVMRWHAPMGVVTRVSNQNVAVSIDLDLRRASKALYYGKTLGSNFSSDSSSSTVTDF